MSLWCCARTSRCLLKCRSLSLLLHTNISNHGATSVQARSSVSFPSLSNTNSNTNAKSVGLLGVKEDRNGSFLRGPSGAPALIREHLHCSSSNAYSELGVNVLAHIHDYGDIDAVADIADSHMDALYSVLQPIVSRMILQDKMAPLFLGGDHSISSSLVKAVSITLQQPLYIVHFDAHPDIYEDFEGNVSSHASQFARILEQRYLCDKLISIGIRTATPHQREQFDKYNVTVIEAKDFPAHGSGIRETLLSLIPCAETTPVYISFDMDVIEPGLSPGVSHREAGGITVRQAIDAIHAIPGRIVGADLVEYNPTRDVDFITAKVASKLLKEIASKIVHSTRY